MKSSFLISLCWLISSLALSAQTNTVSPYSAQQAGGNADANATIESINVNEFTGTAGVSIPLVSESTILGGSIGVQLNHSGAGVRVEELGGYVGNSWGLNYGGEITRIVRGVPDEAYIEDGQDDPVLGYCHNDKQISYVSDEDKAIKDYDFEADLFTFNVGGFIGSFMLKKNDRQDKVLMITSSDVEIDYEIVEEHFTFQGWDDPFGDIAWQAYENKNIYSIKFTVHLPNGQKWVMGEVDRQVLLTYNEDVKVSANIDDAELLSRLKRSDCELPKKAHVNYLLAIRDYDLHIYESSWKPSRIDIMGVNVARFFYEHDLMVDMAPNHQVYRTFKKLRNGAPVEEQLLSPDCNTSLGHQYFFGPNDFGRGVVSYYSNGYSFCFNRRISLIKIKTISPLAEFDKEIRFSYLAPRQDLLSIEDLNGPVHNKLLSHIEVAIKGESTDKLIYRKITLSYSLLKETPTSCSVEFLDQLKKRHVLSDIRLFSAADNDLTNTPLVEDPGYHFGYDQTALPHRRSLHQDIWGYYNGGDNAVSLVPQVYVYPADPVNNAFYGSVYSYFPRKNHAGAELITPGEDRKSVEAYAKAGILNHIEYPNGSISDLDYESNQFTIPNIVPAVLNNEDICKVAKPSRSDVQCNGLGATYIINNSSTDPTSMEISPVILNYSLDQHADLLCNSNGSGSCSQEFYVNDDGDASAQINLLVAYDMGSMHSTLIIKRLDVNLLIYQWNIKDGLKGQKAIPISKGLYKVYLTASSGITLCNIKAKITSAPKTWIRYTKPDGSIEDIKDNSTRNYYNIAVGQHKVEVFVNNALLGHAARAKIRTKEFAEYAGSGLRIKRVRNLIDGKVLERTYEYKKTDGTTSGVLYYLPEFARTLICGVGCSGTDLSKYTSVYSSSHRPISTTLPLVGYSRITQVINDLGKIITEYENNAGILGYTDNEIAYYKTNLPSCMADRFPLVEPSFKLSTGRLLKTETLNKVGSKTNEDVYSYHAISSESISMYKYIFQNIGSFTSSVDNYAGRSAVYPQKYNITSRLDKVTSISYGMNGGQMTSVRTILYDGTLQIPIGDIVSNGDGQDLESRVNYSINSSNPLFSIYKIKYVPLQQETKRNGQVVKGVKIDYLVKNLVISPTTYPLLLPHREYQHDGNSYVLMNEVLEYDLIFAKRVKSPADSYETVYNYNTATGELLSSSFGGIVTTFASTHATRRIHRATDINAIVSQQSFDHRGRIATSVNGAGTATISSTYTYNDNIGNFGAKVKNDAASGDMIPDEEARFDAMGTLISSVHTQATQNAGAISSSTEYDVLQRPIKICRQTEGGCVRYEYPASLQSLPISSKHENWAKGTSMQYGYNAQTVGAYVAGTLSWVQTTDENGNTSKVYTNKEGWRILEERQTNGGSVSLKYTYDVFGRLIQVTQPMGTVFTNTYSYAGGWKVSRTIPGRGAPIETQFDTYGKQKSHSDGGLLREFVYDSYNRLDYIQCNGTQIVKNEYYDFNASAGSRGKLKVEKYRLIQPDLSFSQFYSRTYEYDGSGREIKESSVHLNGSDIYEYKNYTARGEAQKIIRNHQAYTSRLITSESKFTPAGPTDLTISLGNQSFRVCDRYDYDGNNRLINKSLGKVGSKITQGISYGYNNRGWIERINDIPECTPTVAGQNDVPIKQVGEGFQPGGAIIRLTYNPASLKKCLGYLDVYIKLYGTDTLKQVGQIQKTINLGTDSSPTGSTQTFTYYLQGMNQGRNMGLIVSALVNDRNKLIYTSPIPPECLRVLQEYLRGVQPTRLTPDCKFDEGAYFAEKIYYEKSTPAVSSAEQYNGNISYIKWRTRNRDVSFYGMKYDPLNQLLDAKYVEQSTQGLTKGQIINKDRYTAIHSYDANGNITNISRQGPFGSGPGATFVPIDVLALTYATNKLQSVSETGIPQEGYGLGSGAYTFDSYGRQTVDPQKAITNITYNYLNLPARIEKSATDYVEFWYTTAGDRVRTLIKQQGKPDIRIDYCDGIEYTNGVLTAINHPEGRLLPYNNTLIPEYVISDHLGSGRVWLRDINLDGLIDPVPANGELVQEAHYYPYGLQMRLLDQLPSVPGGNRFTFNGIEYFAELGLKTNFAFYRSYDPSVGRWMQVDPKAETLYGMTPFNGMANSPFVYTDEKGDWVHIVIGAAIGGVVNLGVKAFQGKIKNPWDGVKAFSIGAVAGGAAALTGGAAIGAGGFIGGAAAGATGAFTGSAIQNLGNNLAFNDPIMTTREFARDVLIGAVTGGLASGAVALIGGRNFWNGNIRAAGMPPFAMPGRNTQELLRQGWERSGRGWVRPTVEFDDLTVAGFEGVEGATLDGFEVGDDLYALGANAANSGGLTPLGLGSTGRTVAANLTEQLAMREALSNPTAGQIIGKMAPLKDSRWLGWRKMQYEHIAPDGTKTTIHYNGQWINGVLKAIDDFKFN